MAAAAESWATGDIDFPWNQTLVVAAEWIQQHCIVPDGFDRGLPFYLSGWQQHLILNFYRVKPSAPADNAQLRRPLLATAFVNRRSQTVLPQKMGKAPITAAQVCLEAVGPALFAGWALGGETWDCRDHGCGCGWIYEYEPGEAMGMSWPTPLIQITATSEEQTGNIYDALRPMIDNGPLCELIPKTGEEFIRLPNDGRIDAVTSSATSRLGQRVTHAPQDETGLWTPQNKMTKVADTQRRGLAGMGGRAAETTNAWDPTVDSQAKRTATSKQKDIFRLHPLPPIDLDYRKKPERQKIHAYVYQGSPWVDLNAIEAEAAELMETDAAQAERFFGNRIVAGSGKAFDLERWQKLAKPELVIPNGEMIVLGFDGAKFFDSTALVATHIESGQQWPIAIWERPDELGKDDDWEVDAVNVNARMEETFDLFKVWWAYADPPYWEDTVNGWAGRFGLKRIRAWYTNRAKPMAFALRSYKNAMSADERPLSHNGDEVLANHVGNAVKADTNALDDEGKPMWLVKKEAPKSPLKIDGAMAGCLSWEARGDAIAAGALRVRKRTIVAF